MQDETCYENFRRSLAWRKLGVSAFPIVYKQKRPMVKWSNYRDKTPLPSELKRFFTSYKTNLGIICGGSFGLTIIDFDEEDGYAQFMSDLSSGIKNIFEKTYKVKTPRGVHVYLRAKGMRSLKDTERKIDVKAIGGYVVAPCSVHPSGEKYVDMIDFNNLNILSMPTELIEKLFPQQERERTDWDGISSYAREEENDLFNVNADLDDIRRANPILRLAMQYTPMFQERRGSDYYKGKCPLPTHDDKDPSFWVNTRTGLCGCFGNCELSEKATDVIGLYAKLNGITYGEAIKKLRE